MGIKELWSVLTPYAERKPLSELRGKIVAIDLAGWVCESLNAVDYFVHPRQHLKNLFFRTCYLIWEEVTPIFVLEGTAPSLKSQVIEQRNELQFRGVKAKKHKNTDNNVESKNDNKTFEAKKRTRFNHILKQCENLLKSMGIECVQGPGEAEAYCAFLNRKNLVDGVISQDSDCFAYGAVRVYRNFSISTQGAQSAQGGAVDIYDMKKICEHMDFGQNKIIAMALFCGCDYCPEGIGGIGRDSVLKLFSKYKEDEILQRLSRWRKDSDKYSSLEIRVNDKNSCSNCGHIGRVQAHAKSGCGICRTLHGCDETLWREQRLSIKAELILRKKALADPNFPCVEIIKEFKSEPAELPKLKLHWSQPNMIKFMKQIAHLLQWSEIYAFSKFLPILTRWQLRNSKHINATSAYVIPKEILKKRTIKGVTNLEIIWNDEQRFFDGLIPDEQLQTYALNENGLQKLWSTLEPLALVEAVYPALVENFFKTNQKPQKTRKKSKTAAKKENARCHTKDADTLNLEDLAAVTAQIAENVAKTGRGGKQRKRSPLRGIQHIDKFFKTKAVNISPNSKSTKPRCSTPHLKSAPSDLDSDDDNDGDVYDEINVSAVIDGMIKQSSKQRKVFTYSGRLLQYEQLAPTSTFEMQHSSKFQFTSKDDLNLNLATNAKREHSIVTTTSLDDSFDVLVKAGENRQPEQQTHIKRFKLQHNLSATTFKNSNNSFLEQFEQLPVEQSANASYFFASGLSPHKDNEIEDEFERFMQASFVN